MADATMVAIDPPPEPPSTTVEFGSGCPLVPQDAAFFSQDILEDDGAPFENQNADPVLDELDLDFSFDDLCVPCSGDLDDLLNPVPLQQPDSQTGEVHNFVQFAPKFGKLHAVFKSTSPELRHLPGDCGFSGDLSWDDSGVLDSSSPAMESHQISGYLNVPSPESNGSNPGSSENCGAHTKGLNCPSPESRGSGNFGSNVSEESNNCPTRSVSSSQNSSNSSIKTRVVDQKIKLEEIATNDGNNTSLKRKKGGEDSVKNNVESTINKYRISNCSVENNKTYIDVGGISEEEEKRKARLMRNRESAQLSRQRKKHYVEELEDKVKTMHSTIQYLNAKISYFVAENATLRQQMAGGGGGGAAAAASAAASSPLGPQPPHGMYPHPAMMYPWMPCAPPYMMKPQGQVPLVPIPRLKLQQPSQVAKADKKVESKKKEGQKTKKVAGVSFLGLVFFIMLFVGLVPMVNMRYGGVREVFTGGEIYSGVDFNEKHHGRVLMVNGTEYGEKHRSRRGIRSNSSLHCGQTNQSSGGEPSADEFVRLGNGSEPLAASLYVPRNDKLVKIDGNLIIHSVLASEKAMASQGKGGGETGLAVPRDFTPAIPVPSAERNVARHPRIRALGSTEDDGMKSTATDGRLQQWFREGLAGPMLSTGMCSEVFQFDASAASGAIVPATSTRNMSEEQNQNSMHLNKGKNRRILHSIPHPESYQNISREHTGRGSEDENMNGNNNTSSMVVSVLFDPREAGDADVDGVMGKKSLSRIFVVVLVDSVKYVTYSCMLPFAGSATHLVTS